MNQVRTQVIKAREVEVSYVIDERDTQDIENLDRLRKEGVRDFGGKFVDVKLTDYLTVHNVIAIADIKFESASHKQMGFRDGSLTPRKATVAVKLIIDNARSAVLHPENLIQDGGNDVLELPVNSVRTLK